jgi:hypothetical protein
MLAILRSGERLSWPWLLSAVLQRRCEGYGSLRCLVRVRQARRLLQQHGVSAGELMLPRAGESHRDADPADADADQRADFEQLQPDRPHVLLGELAGKRPVRAPLPAHLPRERVVVTAPPSCPCCGGKLVKLGEDVTETLEVVPRQWRVIQTVREKFSCRSCEKRTFNDDCDAVNDVHIGLFLRF